MSAPSSAVEVAELARALYGAPLGAMDGVLHVVAVAEEGDAHRVLRIGPHAPKSETDFFVLGLARARVGAILVSGAVLRAEPELRYELSPALRAWRRVLGLDEPPFLLVLTRGDVDLAHPALHGEARPIVFTGPAAGRSRAQGSIEIVSVAEPSARAAIDHLRRDRGCRGVSIEAGPRVAAPLYDPPPAIDELMRSVSEGPLDPRARGGALPSPAHLELVASARPDPDAPWRFERWVRAR